MQSQLEGSVVHLSEGQAFGMIAGKAIHELAHISLLSGAWSMGQILSSGTVRQCRFSFGLH
jgi:hypothetical protein